MAPCLGFTTATKAAARRHRIVRSQGPFNHVLAVIAVVVFLHRNDPDWQGGMASVMGLAVIQVMLRVSGSSYSAEPTETIGSGVA
jgi:hypothetical protein